MEQEIYPTCESLLASLVVQDIGVARGYICPIRLVYTLQPFSFDTPGAILKENLDEAYEKARQEKMKKVLVKEYR